MSLGFECLRQKKILVFPISFPESYGRSIGIFRVVRICVVRVRVSMSACPCPRFQITVYFMH